MKFLFFSRILCIVLLYVFELCSMSHASEMYIKSDISEYVKSMLADENSTNDYEDKSLSISNNPNEIDKSETTSFADAFLWASGIRTKLTTSAVSRLNIVYLHNSPWTKDTDIDNADYKLVFRHNFEAIKYNGPCARVDLSNTEGKKFTIVYLDANQKFDVRLSCIYRHFRNLYGISEKYQMPDFNSTFVTDLRILRCKHRRQLKDIADFLYSGQC